ncbi:FadR/GntR family transcriptional regulator [Stakelama saccharophila]|uniref:FadR/GntR family transcriptional regulator n=1 Tax=Stakelama saccharophila TaxID=3075605 RepID=A0ABZ0B4S7_9SPHN|nr:FadR/GntR family transcriptional regulator [Stakelama sp. W311]WNO52379.1 FadR/GntR family transcriptional regulator [Stakelama sp. W311]
MTAPAAPKLYRAIIDTLQDEIATGKYKPGDRLPPERELVERFEVSRLTLREAMIGMEIMGLVEARRGSGVYVTERSADILSPSDLDIGAFELTEARRLVEGESAALAAVTANAGDIAALREVLDRMVAENERELEDEVADRDFHLRIAEATRNDAMVLVVQTLWDVRHRSPLSMKMLERSRRAGVKPRIDDHRAILDAIAAGDAHGARKAMRDHLGRVIDHLLTATEIDRIERVRAEAAELRNRVSRFATT